VEGSPPELTVSLHEAATVKVVGATLHRASRAPSRDDEAHRRAGVETSGVEAVRPIELQP